MVRAVLAVPPPSSTCASLANRSGDRSESGISLSATWWKSEALLYPCCFRDSLLLRIRSMLRSATCIGEHVNLYRSRAEAIGAGLTALNVLKT